ncbi:MAG: hypothetical protein Q9M25_00860 [Mariprofundaceae bacterium]|nr:hypothetical protein [Mariprofundaceae bacterium]
MRNVNVFLMALLLAGTLTACNDHDADDRMEGHEVVNKNGCNIVFAKGLGVTIPEVIAATDKTAKNDALSYYASLGEEGQEKITQAVYQRALKTFKCVAPASSGKTCMKHVRVSLGIGMLPKLKKDLLVVQAERSCRFK